MADVTNESGLREKIAAELLDYCVASRRKKSVSISHELAANLIALISPAGEVSVPVEPTEAMIKAGDEALFDGPDASEYVWAAMLSAAPRGMEG